VVGSGPAGMAAAQQLARAGHDVTLFEKNDRVGGLLRYGIPDFKMEKSHIDRRVAQMQAEGVVFRTGVMVGTLPEDSKVTNWAKETISPEQLQKDFDAVLLTGGSEQSRDLPVPGRDLAGIHFAMEFLPQQNKVNAGDKLKGQLRADGKHVIVIGGGDTGSDCVGTSNRHGAVSVTQFEVMPQPPVEENRPMTWPYWPLKLRTSSSHEEGCEREFAISTKEFIGENGKVTGLKTVHIEFKDGKMVEVPGTEKTYKADLVLLAMGFVNPVATILDGFGVDKDARGNAKRQHRLHRRLRHQRAQGVCRGRHAPRPVAGGLGDPRRPPGRPRGGRVPDGRQRPAALTLQTGGIRVYLNALSCKKPGSVRLFAFMNPLQNDALVEFRNLTFGYGERVILDDISLTIARGKVTAVMGASGGGKTTILRLIGGQWKAQKGKVFCSGRRGAIPRRTLALCNRHELILARRRMGMLFQFGALFTDLSVFENVAFPLREHTDLPEALIRDVVLLKLNAVGLRGARDLMPSEISGGMARRVALARAIALDPELVMYDEPFSGLDPISLGTAARLIRQLNDAMGLTSIVVSHDLDETFQIADQVIVLANGRMAAQGTPDEVRNSTDPLVHQFVNGQSDGPVRFHYPAPPVGQDFCGAPVMSGSARPTWAMLGPPDAGGMGPWRPAALAPGHCCSVPVSSASGWCATRFFSWATIRWPSSRCPACLSGLCWGCRATTRCSATARPRRWACWWR
jgi:ABC-type transporter Mla maintaining outer membrane lipid asymmetry ATPase subunit MlaF